MGRFIKNRRLQGAGPSTAGDNLVRIGVVLRAAKKRGSQAGASGDCGRGTRDLPRTAPAKHPEKKDGSHRRFRYTQEGWEIVQRQPRTDAGLVDLVFVIDLESYQISKSGLLVEVVTRLFASIC
jgi:hypothetical protein